jgi:hypothetical protein
MPIWKIWKSEEQEKSPLYVGSKSERTGTEKNNFVELIEYGTQNLCCLAILYDTQI